MPMAVASYVRQRDAGGKFVVLAPKGGGEGGVFVLSDFSRDGQHAHILARWREAAGGAVPPDLRVAGGGWWKYVPDAERLVLYGQSAAYGPYDRDHLRRHLVPGSVMGEREIIIR